MLIACPIYCLDPVPAGIIHVMLRQALNDLPNYVRHKIRIDPKHMRLDTKIRVGDVLILTGYLQLLVALILSWVKVSELHSGDSTHLIVSMIIQ